MNIEPLISIEAFIVGFIVFMIVARIGVDIYVKYSDKKEARESLARSASDNKAIQRYYNRKGA